LKGKVQQEKKSIRGCTCENKFDAYVTLQISMVHIIWKKKKTKNKKNS